MASFADAGLIGRRQAAGGGVASRMDHRAPAPVRNHARDNVLAMRQKERQNRGRSVIESLKMPQEDFKLKQFANVKSRLFELPRPAPNRQLPCERPPPCERYSHDTGEQGGDSKEEEMDLASFEAECERLKQLHGRKAAAPKEVQIKKDSAGCPAYLQKIKSGLADKQRQAEAERLGPQIPAGYRQLPEGERQETLEALQKKREELEKAFRQLPLQIETAAQRRREQTLQNKIKESDEAIKTFSNPAVLIEA